MKRSMNHFQSKSGMARKESTLNQNQNRKSQMWTCKRRTYLSWTTCWVAVVTTASCNDSKDSYQYERTRNLLVTFGPALVSSIAAIGFITIWSYNCGHPYITIFFGRVRFCWSSCSSRRDHPVYQLVAPFLSVVPLVYFRGLRSVRE